MRESDCDAWRAMRRRLWPDATEDDARAWLARGDAVTLIAIRGEGDPCGFAEVGCRAFADGCASSPVAYLEGWWVEPDARRAGIGRALVAAAAAWARARGLTELASDAELDNAVSIDAHAALGFEEVARAVLFRQAL